MENLRQNNLFVAVVFVQVLLYITIILNIPFAGQVVGFLYLTFIPGIALIFLLKLKKLSLSEFILLSVGLSVAFLMIAGLFLNGLGPLIGVSKTLSLEPLLITISVLVLIMHILASHRNHDLDFNVGKILKKSPITLLSIVLPFLSVAGVMLVKVSNQNFLLLLMLIMVSILFFLNTLFFVKKYSNFRRHLNYSLMLFSISLALILHKVLISNYTLGFDIHLERYIFHSTQSSLSWNPNLFAGLYQNNILYNKNNAMLSITILPTIYSVISNMEEAWILKIIYPFIYSLLPLGLYQLYKTQMSRKTALLAVFFFMANGAFLQPPENAGKQIIAELFYVLLFIVLFNKNMKPVNKKILFIIFSFGLVASHYTIAYVFLFLIFFTWLYAFITKNKIKKITVTLILLFSVIAFSWFIYSEMKSGPFDKLIETNDRVLNRFFSDFLNPESRGKAVQRGLWVIAPESPLHMISRIYFYAVEFFILIGVVILIFMRKKIDPEYRIISILNMAFLSAAILLPNFANTFSMDRLYQILLIFLSPFFVIGGRFILRDVLKFKKAFCDLFLISTILIPFFLFQTGFIYEVAMDDHPSSFSLSGYRTSGMWPSVINENDVFGARWLSKYSYLKRVNLYSDSDSLHHVLLSYGLIDPWNYMYELSNDTKPLTESYLFFSTQMNQLNITMSRISISNGTDKIYSNGRCEVYKIP